MEDKKLIKMCRAKKLFAPKTDENGCYLTITTMNFQSKNIPCTATLAQKIEDGSIDFAKFAEFELYRKPNESKASEIKVIRMPVPGKEDSPSDQMPAAIIFRSAGSGLLLERQPEEIDDASVGAVREELRKDWPEKAVYGQLLVSGRFRVSEVRQDESGHRVFVTPV